MESDLSVLISPYLTLGAPLIPVFYAIINQARHGARQRGRIVLSRLEVIAEAARNVAAAAVGVAGIEYAVLGYVLMGK